MRNNPSFLHRSCQALLVKCLMPLFGDIPQPHSPNRPGSPSKLQTSLECICSGCPAPFLTLCSPLDPLFVEIGDLFLAEQKKEFGTNHIYSVDPFNELLPPNRSEKHFKRLQNRHVVLSLIVNLSQLCGVLEQRGKSCFPRAGQ